jgi:predicted negative regulator of RcsB-dependent stress response
VSTTSEDEQIAQIKDWWQRNGKPLLTGGILALAVVLGWQAWQRHQTNQADQASMVYQQLLEEALTPGKEQTTGPVVELASKLKTEFGGTAYAQYAGLFVAKLAVDSGKLDDAANELKAIVDKPFDDTLGELARQRLARVLSAQGKVDDGLKLLEAGKPVAQFTAAREEVKGDLLTRLGRADEAHAAYQKAKAALAEEAAQGTLQMKLDDLAKGDA